MKKKIAKLLAAFIIAFGYGTATRLVYFMTDRNLLLAIILNTLIIITIVIWDKVESLQVQKQEVRAKTRNGLLHADIPVKAGLYLFYVVILIATALLAGDPNLPFLRDFSAYFSSVYYGLLILVAADEFVAHLF